MKCCITVAALLAVLMVPAPLKSQSGAAKIPRLHDGKPDFNGLWDRPRVADVSKDGNACGSGNTGCKQQGGEVALTAAGNAAFKNPKKFDYAGYCQPWGYTRAWQTEYPVEIMQTPQRLAILWESNNVFHIVPTDGRPAPKVEDPTWMGKSVGRYEGDTLVIDTTGFNGITWIDTAQHPSSESLQINERFRHLDANHLEYTVTWTDPVMYTKPIKNVRTFTRMKPGDEIMEWWCMENNRDLLNGHLVDGNYPKK